MTRAQKKRLKTVLETKLAELIRGIAERQESLAIEPGNDPMEQVRGMVEREPAVRDVERMYGDVRLVKRALRGILEGTFGVCAECGSNIPAKRLEALPWSPYCVACQERKEHSEQNGEPEEDESPYALAG